MRPTETTGDDLRRIETVMVGSAFSGVSSRRTPGVHIYTQASHESTTSILSFRRHSARPRAARPVVVNGLGDELLTVNDAPRFLRVTVSWVYEHTRDDAEDRLPFVKLGKYVRFDRTDLREFIDAKRQAARSGARRR